MGLVESPRPLRVTNIIEEGRWAGPQKRITLVSSALKQHAVETVVLLPKWVSTHFREELDKAGVTSKALSLHRLGRGWKTLAIYALTFFTDVFAIWRVLRRGHYDAIHVSGGAWQFKGAIADRLACTPVIWHLNDTQMLSLLVALVLGGTGDLEPLVMRYRAYAAWAEKYDANFVDFDAIKRDPMTLILKCGFSTTADHDQIARHLARWNPTKRTKRLPQEAEIKQQLLSEIQRDHEDLWNAYQDLKSRA